MTIPENQLLLAALTLPEMPRRVLEDFLSSPQIDWQGLHQRAHVLGIKHLLFHQLNVHGFLERVPVWLKNDCEADYFKNAARNSVLLANAHQIRATFASHDIALVFLKGISFLFEELFPAVNLRTLSDIDILVHEEDLQKSENLLLEMGYRLSDQTPLDAKTYRRKKNHLKPYISPDGSPVEVHWCLEPYRPSQNIAQDKSSIWKKASIRDGYLCLSPESHLINLAIHLTKTDLFSFESLIKARLDWDALLKRYGHEINWQQVRDEIVNRDLTYEWNWTRQALRATGYDPGEKSDFYFEVSSQTDTARRRIAAYLLYSKPETKPHEAALSISLGKELYFRRKIALLWRIIWPEPAYVAKAFGLSPTNPRLIFYYPLRLILLAKAFLWPKRLLSHMKSARDWREAVLIFWTICKLPFYQRFLSLDGMLKKLSKTTTPIQANDQIPPKLQNTIELGEWFLGLNVAMFRPTCLKRSLLFYRLFRREGLPVTIHFGLRSEDKKLDGHAWLTLNNQIILDDNPNTFTETYHFP